MVRIILRQMKTSYKKIIGAVEVVLEYAATYNLAWVIPLLLKYGTRASSPRDIRGLQKAAASGHEEVVAMLSKKIHWHRGRKLSAALIKAPENGYEGTVKILLKEGAARPRNPSSPGAKHLVAKEGRESILKLLIAKDPEDYFVKPLICLNTKNARVTTRQVCYIRHGSMTAIDTLIETGARKDVKDTRQRTVLHYAAVEGRSEVIPHLLGLGFDIEARDEEGQTPLHLARYEGSDETYNVLVSHGVDPEAKNNKGKTTAQCQKEKVEEYPTRWWGA